MRLTKVIFVSLIASSIFMPAFIGKVSAQPAPGTIPKEYVITPQGIESTNTRLIFARCLYGQVFQSNACVGEAQLVTAAEAVDKKSEQALKPWRLPTSEELNPLLKYYIGRTDSPVPRTNLLTSSVNVDGSLSVIRFDSFIADSGQRFSMQSSAKKVQQTYLLLVREK